MDRTREKQLIKVAMMTGLSAKEAKTKLQTDEAFRKLCEMYLDLSDRYITLRYNEYLF